MQLPDVRVLRLLVSSEVDFPLECSSADVTRERLEACVLPAVGDEVRGLTEGLAAYGALVGLLTCNQRKRFRNNHGELLSDFHLWKW